MSATASVQAAVTAPIKQIGTRVLRRAPSQGPVRVICDVCVVGSGSAGIAAAIESARLTDADKAALDFFDATARRDDLAVQMAFEPGDIQLLNNLTVLHGRAAYTDHPEPERRRYLLRLWLKCAEASPWGEEDDVMRNAYARFGNLGWESAERHLIRNAA